MATDTPLPQGDQEEVLPPAQCQSSLTVPENIIIPIHPPLIINLNNEEDDEEDDEEDNEENYVPDWVPKTAEDIAEERAIKEICYKSGEFYGIQQPDQQQSPNPVSPSQETELLPLGATRWDLQKESHTAEPKLQPSYQPKGHYIDGENNSSPYHEKEAGRKTSVYYSEPQTSAYVVNWTVTVTKEPKFSGPTAVPEPSVWKCSKGKNEPGKNRRIWTQTGNYDVSDWVPKTAEDIKEERAIKEICYKSGEFYGIQLPDQQQSPNPMSLSQGTVLLPMEATRWDLQKDDRKTSPPELNNTSREGESTGRRVPKESISRTGCRSFENGESHTAEPNAQPSYQPKGHCKDGENDSLPNVREPGRKSYFCSSEPRRSAYVVYRTVTVTQKPKFTGPRAVPEPSVWKCSKGKNEPDKNRRFWMQTGNYDKYSSGSYNAPTWRRRNSQAKTFSKTKTTIQQRQEDMEVNRKGKQYEESREMKEVLEFTRKI